MVKCCGPSKYSARQLREPVTFERKVRTADGAGAFFVAWTAISDAPTRAMVKPMSGRERWASDRTEASVNYRIVTRYSANIKPGDAVLIRGRRGDIHFVGNVDMADEWLEIDVNLGAAV